MEIILFIVGVVAVITFIVWLTSPGNVDGPKALRAFVIFFAHLLVGEIYDGADDGND